MVGLNPEFAHETMSGLSFHHAVAQTLWHGKLFHIDLNAQRIGKFDQDFRFGSEGIRDAFYLVKLLEESGWDGMRHFDAHAYRTESPDGRVGLRPRVHAHLPDPAGEGATVRARIRRSRPRSADAKVGRAARADARRRWPRGRHRRAPPGCRGGRPRRARGQGYGHERLDQLVTELLLGVR